jgi:hypothetical protein
MKIHLAKNWQRWADVGDGAGEWPPSTSSAGSDENLHTSRTGYRHNASTTFIITAYIYLLREWEDFLKLGTKTTWRRLNPKQRLRRPMAQAVRRPLLTTRKPGLAHGQFMLNLWWTKRQSFGFPLSNHPTVAPCSLMYHLEDGPLATSVPQPPSYTPFPQQTADLVYKRPFKSTVL